MIIISMHITTQINKLQTESGPKIRGTSVLDIDKPVLDNIGVVYCGTD